MAPDSAPPRFACEHFGRHFDLSGSCPLSYDVADIGTFGRSQVHVTIPASMKIALAERCSSRLYGESERILLLVD